MTSTTTERFAVLLSPKSNNNEEGETVTELTSLASTVISHVAVNPPS